MAWQGMHDKTSYPTSQLSNPLCRCIPVFHTRLHTALGEVLDCSGLQLSKDGTTHQLPDMAPFSCRLLAPPKHSTHMADDSMI